MSDYLIDLANGNFTGKIVKSLGLPAPKILKREKGGYTSTEFSNKKFLVGAASQAYANESIQQSLKSLGVANLKTSLSDGEKTDVIIYDATGIKKTDDLIQLHQFFQLIIKKLAAHGKVVVFANDPQFYDDLETAVIGKGVEGFVRALGKEIGGKAANANLVYLNENAANQVNGVLRFLCSYRTTYVSGQVFRLTDKIANEQIFEKELLKDKVAIVTGAARGLGAATVERLAEEGAKVICLDISFAKEALEETAKKVGGEALLMDISAENTPFEIAQYIKEKFGKIDVIVHNAGITRDKMLGNMTEEKWNQVIAVNLKAIMNIDKKLIADDLINEGGKIVCLSSVSGIAGNIGQTNYATSKAALITYVEKQSKLLADKKISINAVAPGFIETEMTKKIPAMIREFGRRLNAMSQGGQPRDVAELVAFLSCPESSAITGQTIRVCGQALIGA